MAKRKASQPKPTVEPAAPAPVPKSTTVKTILSMRGSEAWDEWLTMAAKKARTDRVGFLDRAAAELAEKLGIPEPPPRL